MWKKCNLLRIGIVGGISMHGNEALDFIKRKKFHKQIFQDLVSSNRLFPYFVDLRVKEFRIPTISVDHFQSSCFRNPRVRHLQITLTIMKSR